MPSGEPRFLPWPGVSEVPLSLPSRMVSAETKREAWTPLPLDGNKAPLSLSTVSMETEWKAQISIPAH